MSQSPFGLALFDLDGTLVDSGADIRAALAAALAAVAPPPGPNGDARAIAAAALGLPLDELFAIARGRRPRDEEARFVSAYRAHYHAHLPGAGGSSVPFPGVVELLERLVPLRARGLKIAVATTKRSDTARRVTDGLGLTRYLDAVFGTEPPMPHKPAPDLLVWAARALERPLPEARGVMIGDTERDLIAGRAAGLVTVGVAWGGLGAAGLAPHRPDHLVAAPSEIFAILAE